jgi:hypothetical protein
MADANEIAALKAACRGAVRAAEALQAVHVKVEGLDPNSDIAADDLEELARVTAAHAIASAALRGLVVTMQTRRSGGTA